MKKIVLTAGLALMLIWGVWGGIHVARGQVSSGDIIINELAWGGTAANSYDEWIELYNTTGTAIDLNGWTLSAADDTPSITLSGTIAAQGYFLLERADDNTVSDITADQVYGSGASAWSLNNDGETLELRDATDILIDTANGDGGAWPAGSGSPYYYSMERIDPAVSNSDTNWAANDGLTRNGLDADSDPVNGTPRAQNSAHQSSAEDYLVRLYALHPYALRSDDEAVALINLDTVTATLTGWGLSDQEGGAKVTLPAAQLAPGEIIWLADDADAFYTSFGFVPDFALTHLTRTVPSLAGTWPGFANDGDETILYNGSEEIVDTLIYGTGIVATSGWSGDAVPYPRSGYGSGQIIYRKLDQTSGIPVTDTDTAANWAQDNNDDINGKKVRFPGWDLETFFFPAQITETASLTVWVAPDGLYEGLAGELQKAQNSLVIEGYTFESAELVGVITGLLQSGVAVQMLLEGWPAFGMDDQELWACGQMADAGAEIYFMHNDTGGKIYDRYDYQHAKFIIVDGGTLLIGTENFSSGGMPADDKSDGTWGHRGVYLATNAPGVVARAQAIFDRDLDTAHNDIVPWGSGSYIPPVDFTPTYSPDFTDYTAFFSTPLTLNDTFAFEVIQSPDNSLRDQDALLGLLARAGAGDVVLVEQLYERQTWASGDNPRLEAYIAAARRGARVQLLLDSYFDASSNQTTANYANAIAFNEGLDLEIRLGNPTGEGIHNKMVLVQIDGRGYIHVGSINGSQDSHKANRELALQVESDEAYLFLKSVFDHDWQASWQSAPGVQHLYLPLLARNYVPPADHLVISELLYDPAGIADAGGEWIEIYNPTGITVTLAGHSLSDGSSYGDGTAVFPGGSIAPEGVVVIAQKAAEFSLIYGFAPDFELKSTDAAVPDMSPAGAGIGWGNSGDEAILRDATGATVDVVVYGSGSYSGVTAHPGVGWGHSLERRPAHRDTNDCSSDFWERYTPDPGQVTLD